MDGYDGAEVAVARSELATVLLLSGAAPDGVSGLYTLDFTLGQDEAKAIWRKTQS